jgi:Zn-dependent peptidase ImmA (M78 family)
MRVRVDGVSPQTIERTEPPRTAQDLEELAVETRYLLRQQSEGPIRNLTAAVERAGVCVVPIVGLDSIDGLSAWVEGVPVIGGSPTVLGDRLRLTLSHELAHLTFHTRMTDTTEPEANRFAGALLFPQAEFDAQMADRPQLRHFIAMKSAWGVSVAALVYRAHELDHIDDKRYRALQIQMSKWHRAEPATVDPVHGELFGSVVGAGGGVKKVAQALGVHRRHLRDLCNWSHLRAA